MPTKVEELELPSGLKLKVRRPGILAVTRSQAELRTLTDNGSSDGVSENHAAIELMCECCVEPKLWADLRSKAQRARDPLPAPKGFQEFDEVFSYEDYTAFAQQLSKWNAESMEKIRPLLQTGDS